MQKFMRFFHALMAAVLLVGLFISPAFAATEDIELDPEEGEIGEMVVTTLQKEAVPLIRYRTRDLTRLIRRRTTRHRQHHN